MSKAKERNLQWRESLLKNKGRLSLLIPFDDLERLSKMDGWEVVMETQNSDSAAIHLVRFKHTGHIETAILSSLRDVNEALSRLRKHHKRAKGAEAAKLRKLIEKLELAKEEGMKTGADGLTIQSGNWYAANWSNASKYIDLYPDFEEVPSFYVSGALHRNKTRPHTQGGGQLSLFELEPHEVEAITDKGQVVIEEVRANGIKRGLADLTGPEHRLLLGLSQLLHEISVETFDPESKDYYTGHGLTSVGGGQWPYVWISPYDLAVTCKGGDRQRGAVGGKDAQDIVETAKKLAERKFLLSFQNETDTTRNGKPTKTQRTISTQDNIIKLLEFKERETNSAGEVVNERTEIAIGLNPIFRHGIARYFVEYPSDTIARLEETKEGKRIPESVWVLLDYIQTRRSNTKTKEAEVTDTITANALFQKLQPNYMEQNRRTLAKEYTEKALDHCKRSGFLRGYQTGKNKNGEPTYILQIPKETPPFYRGSLQ